MRLSFDTYIPAAERVREEGARGPRDPSLNARRDSDYAAS